METTVNALKSEGDPPQAPNGNIRSYCWMPIRNFPLTGAAIEVIHCLIYRNNSIKCTLANSHHHPGAAMNRLPSYLP